MAQLNFGGVVEEVITREEFPLEKAREILKNETIAVLGYGVQGPGQACNLRDNGFNVIVGQREGKTYEKAKADGWVPGETLFSLEEAAERVPSYVCCSQTLHRCSCGPPSRSTSPQAKHFISHMVLPLHGTTAQV